MLPKIRTTGARILILAVVLALLVAVLVMQTRRVIPEVSEETAQVLTAVPAAYAPERAAFSLKVGDEVIPYRAMGLFVMPGQGVEVAADSSAERRLEIEASGGGVDQAGPGRWRWTAPDEPGFYPITVWDTRSGEAIRLNTFVMVPFRHSDEVIGDFRVGRYQEELLRGNLAYERPQGFIEVTEENRDVLVSPHFTLGQFVSKQTAHLPTYVALRERLLLKLEAVLEAVNRRGIHANTFHVMSAFRTPFYNASIGNETEYSMHLYGGAADVFVDMDGDGNMDDLNADGAVTRADAEFMADLVKDLRDEAWFQPLVGGVGVYSANPAHGPFIHVDVRGQAVDW